MPAKSRQSARPEGLLISPQPTEAGAITLYPYQDEDLAAEWRSMISLQARQTGKTFGISMEALIVCGWIQRARCITLSASLRQGALNIQKDAEVWRTVHSLIRKRFGQDSTLPDKDKKLLTSPADDDKGNLIDIDAISELLESGRLESRVYWSKAAGNYSSHQIWAANPDTARGATAQRVFLDEAFTVADYREVVRAIKHTISRVKGAKFKQKGTPPISSDHESWAILYTEDKFPPCARGNWRRSNAPNGEGTPILQVSGYDAELAGVVSYDDITGALTTVAEKLEKSPDKEGDEREIALIFGDGGSTLIPYSSLKQAQRSPLGAGCAYDLGVISALANLPDDKLRAALRDLVPAGWTAHCTPGDAIGFGHDQSTSDTSGRSNPASLTVVQEAGRYVHTRLIVRWLSKFPKVNDALIEMLIGDAIKHALNLRGLGIDASNEVFNAIRLCERFGHLLSCVLYKNGERHPDAAMSWKEHLAKQYAGLFTDGLMTLPREGGKDTEWVLADHSLAVQTSRGPDWKSSKGNHFDTGCSGMLSVEILKGAPMPLDVARAHSSSMYAPAGGMDSEEDWAIPVAGGRPAAF